MTALYIQYAFTLINNNNNSNRVPIKKFKTMCKAKKTKTKKNILYGWILARFHVELQHARNGSETKHFFEHAKLKTMLN